MLSGPPPADVERMTRALGWRPSAFRRAAEGRGTSETAARWIVADDRRSAFVKIGATELTAGWIRAEHRNYEAIDGWFLPQVLGFDDDGSRPALALEDLSSCVWPPPWLDRQVEAVVEALGSISRTLPPPHVVDRVIEWGVNWRDVEEDPGPFLATSLCSREWLAAHLPDLIAAAESAPITGGALVHLDVRSDNICFRDGRALLVDWNGAGVANPELDIAGWLPSLHAEGGPRPEAILPSAPALAAWIAGFFCSRAGLDAIPEAPHVRPLQLVQGRSALAWASRALGFESPT